jgi:hypothetical protein
MSHIINREPPSIQTWEQFLERWEAIGSQEEATGLLYAPIGFKDKRSLVEQVDFYLVLAVGQGKVARVARQVIVKHWLRECNFYPATMADLHIRLVEFLNERHPDLLSAPYPRFITKYLREVSMKWYFGNQQTARELEKRLQSATRQLIFALLTWGVTEPFVSHFYTRREIIPLVEEFVRRHLVDPGISLGEFPSENKAPIERFSTDRDARDEIWTRADRTLLYLLYRSGVGVQIDSPWGFRKGRGSRTLRELVQHYLSEYSAPWQIESVTAYRLRTADGEVIFSSEDEDEVQAVLKIATNLRQ